MHFTLSRAAAASLLLIGLAAATASSQTPPAQPPGAGRNDALDQMIAGKEQQPAETVFKNVQVLKGVPAAKFLDIMRAGFGPALGVKCRYCHDTENFASDDKEDKRIAREMVRMTQDINEKYLKAMKDLDSDKPTVTCASCHHGQEKPPTTVAPAASH